MTETTTSDTGIQCCLFTEPKSTSSPILSEVESIDELEGNISCYIPSDSQSQFLLSIKVNNPV